MAIGFHSTLGGGTTDKIVSSSAFALPTEFTYLIRMYRRSTGPTTWNSIVSRESGYGDLFSEGTNICIGYLKNDGVGYGRYRWAAPALNKWANIGASLSSVNTGSWGALVYSDGRRLVLGGGILTSGAITALDQSSQLIGLGRSLQSGNSPFDGMLADFAMYNVALTDDEHMRYQNGESPQNIRPDALMQYLPLDRDPRLNLAGAQELWTPTGTAYRAAPDFGVYESRRKSVFLPLWVAAGTNIDVDATPDSISINGLTGNVIHGHTVNTSPITVALSGLPADISVGITINGISGDISVAGNQLSVISGNYINAFPESVVFGTLPAHVGVGIVVDCMSGGTSLSGEQLEIIQAHYVDASADGVSITGLAGDVIQGHTVNALPEQISVTSDQAHISLAMIINAVSAGVSIEALQSVLPEGVLVTSTPGGISITGLQASITLGTTISASPDGISVSGAASDVIQSTFIDLSSDSINLSEDTANVQLSMLINSAVAEIAITGEQSTVTVGGEQILINAISGSISIDALTGAVVHGSVTLIPAGRVIGIHKDNRTIVVTERGRYVS